MDEIYKAIIRQRCRYSDDINVLTIGASKKAEADKPVAAVVSKKPKEEKPSENLKETNQVNINQASAEELAKSFMELAYKKRKLSLSIGRSMAHLILLKIFWKYVE